MVLYVMNENNEYASENIVFSRQTKLTLTHTKTARFNVQATQYFTHIVLCILIDTAPIPSLKHQT
jgi:hypothetical protein